MPPAPGHWRLARAPTPRSPPSSTTARTANGPRPTGPACSTKTSAVPTTIIEGEPMLIHPIADRMRGLGLAAMADAFLEMQRTAVADEISREDWLGLMLDREATSRENKRLGHRLRQARLRHSAVIEDTDYRTPRGLDRALFQKLATCEWIRASQHLVIGGPTRIGK